MFGVFRTETGFSIVGSVLRVNLLLVTSLGTFNLSRSDEPC